MVVGETLWITLQESAYYIVIQSFVRFRVNDVPNPQ